MRKIKDFFYKLRRFIKRLIYLSELWEKEEKENAVKDVRPAAATNTYPNLEYICPPEQDLDDLLDYCVWLDEYDRRQRMMLEEEIFWDELE